MRLLRNWLILFFPSHSSLNITEAVIEAERGTSGICILQHDPPIRYELNLPVQYVLFRIFFSRFYESHANDRFIFLSHSIVSINL